MADHHELTVRQQVYTAKMGALVSEGDMFLLLGRTGKLGEIVSLIIPAYAVPGLAMEAFSYFQLTAQGWERIPSTQRG